VGSSCVPRALKRYSPFRPVRSADRGTLADVCGPEILRDDEPVFRLFYISPSKGVYWHLGPDNTAPAVAPLFNQSWAIRGVALVLGDRGGKPPWVARSAGSSNEHRIVGGGRFRLIGVGRVLKSGHPKDWADLFS